MSTRTAGGHEIYPAKYWSASPTEFRWNPLTAHDIQELLYSRPEYAGQHFYFILNHPIRYVRIVGLVVDINLVASKYLVLTLDDSSGSTIECKVQVRVPNNNAAATTEEWPSTTLVDNLDMHAELGVPNVKIDRGPIDIGSILKVKGTIDTFRNKRQIKMERASIVNDTNEEAKAWREVASWKTDVLSKPWILSEAGKRSIDLKSAEEQALAAELERKKRRRAAEYEEKKRRHEQKKEKKRIATEKAFDAGALGKTSLLPDRFGDS